MVNFKKNNIYILLNIISINSFVFSAAKIETEFSQDLNSSLVNAVNKNNKEEVLNLLSRGANVNARGIRETPVLSLAILKNNKEIRKKIQYLTGMIPDISWIIGNYTQIDKYEDLPLDYRLESIKE